MIEAFQNFGGTLIIFLWIKQNKQVKIHVFFFQVNSYPVKINRRLNQDAC